MNKAKVISIVNEKGGVGKTATATTLSYLLAKEGKRTCLIDFDGQAHSSIILGTNPNKLVNTIYTLIEKIVNDKPLPDSGEYIIHTDCGADLIPANSKLFNLERMLCNVDFREQKLKAVIKEISGLYDYIIIDCMPQMGTPMVSVMLASDEIIIPTQAELLSVQGVGMIFRHSEAIRANGNPGLKIAGILVTMDNSKTSLSSAIKDSLKGSFGDSIRIFDTVIPRSVKVGEACLHKKTICEYRPENPVSKAYEAFAKEYLGIRG